MRRKNNSMVPAMAIFLGFTSALYLAKGLDYAKSWFDRPARLEQSIVTPNHVSVENGIETIVEANPSVNVGTNVDIYKIDDFAKDSERLLLARMIYGEARGCSEEEKIQVGYTAVNRANDGIKWNGETVKEALLVPWQYSCFNQGDANREKLMDPMSDEPGEFLDCLRVADGVRTGQYENIGATSYYDHKMKNAPKWAGSNKMEKIGRIAVPGGKESEHVFYKEKKGKGISYNFDAYRNEFVVQRELRKAA